MTSRKKRDDFDAEEEELNKSAQVSRENQQLAVYLFVCVITILAWILGTLDFSFVWIFLLIVVTFMIWWGKLMKLVEDHIKWKELVVHRRRALRQSETAEWLNFVLNRW